MYQSNEILKRCAGMRDHSAEQYVNILMTTLDFQDLLLTE